MRARRAARGPGPVRRRRAAAEALSQGARRLAGRPPRPGRPHRSGHGNWRRRPTGSSSGSTRSTPSTRNPARTTRSSTTSAGCPNSTRCARPRNPHARRCPGRSTMPPTRTRHRPPTASGRRSRRWKRPTTPRCGRWPSSSASALAVIGDVSTELGDYLAELPSDASTLETKLARQAELRTLTRKYAADIDGVLAVGARVARTAGAARRLRGGARRTGAPRRRARGRTRRAPQPNSRKARTQGGQGPRQSGDRRAVRPGDGRRRVHRRSVAADRPRADDSAPLTLPSGATVHAGSRRCRRRRVRLRRAPRRPTCCR